MGVDLADPPEPYGLFGEAKEAVDESTDDLLLPRAVVGAEAGSASLPPGLEATDRAEEPRS